MLHRDGGRQFASLIEDGADRRRLAGDAPSKKMAALVAPQV
jgi:hypothetical protein